MLLPRAPSALCALKREICWFTNRSDLCCITQFCHYKEWYTKWLEFQSSTLNYEFRFACGICLVYQNSSPQIRCKTYVSPQRKFCLFKKRKLSNEFWNFFRFFLSLLLINNFCNCCKYKTKSYWVYSAYFWRLPWPPLRPCLLKQSNPDGVGVVH